MEAWTDFITALALLIAAVVNGGIGIYGLRRINAVQTTAETTHLAVNSKMDKLLAVSNEASEAKGVLKGREEMKTETKEG